MRGAFSLAETVTSIAVVGLLLVAALNVAGAAVVGRRNTESRSGGELLAAALLSEILQQSYKDPNDTPSFGSEASEFSSNRLSMDDVDDYHGWTASPPEARDGTPLPDTIGWRRTVTVEYVLLGNISAITGTDKGVKRITVTVSRNGVPVATLMALRTGGDGMQLSELPIDTVPPIIGDLLP